MSNVATVSPVSGAPVYQLFINGNLITSHTSATEMNTLASRLNAIFSDPDRDLDFIAPSYSGGYIVACPLVRKNVGQVTYLYDTNGSDGWKQYPEKLYEPTITNDARNSSQTLIYTVPSSGTPWHDALLMANKIRAAINLNFPDANGNSTCQPLTVPTNIGSSTTLISASATCDYYGVPCQGTSPGTHSSCPEIGFPAENILNVNTKNGEVFHPAGLTAAITSTNSWYSTYVNKYVKITNLSNSKSIVVRVTDQAPANRGIEPGYRAWVEIGKPAGSNSVKIELMS